MATEGTSSGSLSGPAGGASNSTGGANAPAASSHAVQCLWSGCSEAFPTEDACFTHLTEVHALDGKQVCAWHPHLGRPVCGQSLRNRGNFGDHVVTHFSTSLRPIQCMLCPMRLRNRQDVKRHETKHQSPEDAAAAPQRAKAPRKRKASPTALPSPAPLSAETSASGADSPYDPHSMLGPARSYSDSLLPPALPSSANAAEPVACGLHRDNRIPDARRPFNIHHHISGSSLYNGNIPSPYQSPAILPQYTDSPYQFPQPYQRDMSQQGGNGMGMNSPFLASHGRTMSSGSNGALYNPSTLVPRPPTPLSLPPSGPLTVAYTHPAEFQGFSQLASRAPMQGSSWLDPQSIVAPPPRQSLRPAHLRSDSTNSIPSVQSFDAASVVSSQTTHSDSWSGSHIAPHAQSTYDGGSFQDGSYASPAFNVAVPSQETISRNPASPIDCGIRTSLIQRILSVFFTIQPYVRIPQEYLNFVAATEQRGGYIPAIAVHDLFLSYIKPNLSAAQVPLLLEGFVNELPSRSEYSYLIYRALTLYVRVLSTTSSSPIFDASQMIGGSTTPAEDSQTVFTRCGREIISAIRSFCNSEDPYTIRLLPDGTGFATVIRQRPLVAEYEQVSSARISDVLFLRRQVYRAYTEGIRKDLAWLGDVGGCQAVVDWVPDVDNFAGAEEAGDRSYAVGTINIRFRRVDRSGGVQVMAGQGTFVGSSKPSSSTPSSGSLQNTVHRRFPSHGSSFSDASHSGSTHYAPPASQGGGGGGAFQPGQRPANIIMTTFVTPLSSLPSPAPSPNRSFKRQRQSHDEDGLVIVPSQPSQPDHHLLQRQQQTLQLQLHLQHDQHQDDLGRRMQLTDDWLRAAFGPRPQLPPPAAVVDEGLFAFVECGKG
ncbi:hypothetical protein HKX48_000847 [Thoreauomyces humboldtii]|nr:hypothetical protein HKX48_000847 [Thoreauomyces humboldtii]